MFMSVCVCRQFCIVHVMFISVLSRVVQLSVGFVEDMVTPRLSYVVYMCTLMISWLYVLM